MNAQKTVKHTRGPWFMDSRSGEICYKSDADDQSFGMACPVNLDDEANARLIAAAPTMYDFVKLCADSGDKAAMQILEAIHASR